MFFSDVHLHLSSTVVLSLIATRFHRVMTMNHVCWFLWQMKKSSTCLKSFTWFGLCKIFPYPLQLFLNMLLRHKPSLRSFVHSTLQHLAQSEQFKTITTFMMNTNDKCNLKLCKCLPASLFYWIYCFPWEAGCIEIFWVVLINNSSRFQKSVKKQPPKQFKEKPGEWQIKTILKVTSYFNYWNATSEEWDMMQAFFRGL